ncbi:hypothetical protein LTR78_004212 [Recurvomyces mirabilis]|uniref:alpha-amylase n=1 Tax=Recurvomyces mirabilis TaxID=574656 RepID=A0AAE0WQG3_9PEZI|nr:hypothetical protein LTR78_004212 [Recurvomyces mirabilis]KAK5153618.1 hypothetical protein LTS14_007312 [Recurvomyces mirabilis]
MTTKVPQTLVSNHRHTEMAIQQGITPNRPLSTGFWEQPDISLCASSHTRVKHPQTHFLWLNRLAIGMKFDAIWISPVVAQLPQMTGDGEAYTAYWQQDLYALNPKFGTEQDLKDLIGEVHARGMLLMLDIVVNHMGYAGIGWADVDYSIFNPFNDAKYFHQFTPIQDPKNQTEVEVGWLGSPTVSLADLKTDDPEVRQMYGDWIEQMVSNYSIDGLRIDTSINVEADFFPGFMQRAGVFGTGEVMMGDDSLACRWSRSIGSILNYPIYYTLTRAFQSCEGSINDLVETINSVKNNCHDPTAMVSFSENHDVPRFRNYTSDMARAKNMITYTILTDGIPVIYQGQEQHMNGDISPYMNRAPLWEAGYNTTFTLYQHIATLNQFRQHVIGTSPNYTTSLNEVIYQDLHSLAMRKGPSGDQVITVLNNNGITSAYFSLPIGGHDFPPGTQLTEILTCATMTVNDTSFLNVEMFAGTPKILYPSHLLQNSSLCGKGVDGGPEPLPSCTTVTTKVPTAISGHPTVVPTTEIVPVSASASTTESSGHPKHMHKALGQGQALSPPGHIAVGAAAAAGAVAAGVLQAGYSGAADMLQGGH